jgi:phosphatidylserine/phosphatidylglycerophosphate/cardiolipin synthase-like enzyme
MNYATNGAYRNDNNVLRVRSARVAENYLVEFEEMFVRDWFGADSVADTSPSYDTDRGDAPGSLLLPGRGGVRPAGGPDPRCETSVHFLAFSFTSDDIAQALVDQARQGITVLGVFEADQVESNQGTEYPRLRSEGLDVHLDDNPRFKHHKIFIIDEGIVMLGSYNFSASAERRVDANILIIPNAKLAQRYLGEFDRIYVTAQP